MTKFHFPTFHEMFPVEKRKLKLLREWLRYRVRRLVFAAQCRALVDFIHENPLWQPVFVQYPYRVNTLLRPILLWRKNTLVWRYARH